MKNVFYFGPVLCAVASLWGDLNAILSADEKKGGRPFVLSSSVLDFKQFVFYDNLFYAGFSGSKYTWCNNQFGISRVVARLDSVLFNSCWNLSMMTFRFFTSLGWVVSDLSPLVIKIGHLPKPLRFLYSLFGHLISNLSLE